MKVLVKVKKGNLVPVRNCLKRTQGHGVEGKERSGYGMGGKAVCVNIGSVCVCVCARARAHTRERMY